MAAGRAATTPRHGEALLAHLTSQATGDRGRAQGLKDVQRLLPLWGVAMRQHQGTLVGHTVLVQDRGRPIEVSPHDQAVWLGDAGRRVGQRPSRHSQKQMRPGDQR